mgnify:CR=1 FL=1
MKSDVQTSFEPKIDDMLSDPVFLAVLKRDNLTIDDVLQVIESYHQNKSSKPN